MSHAVRTIAGIAVLLLLAVIALWLMPPYFENFRLQQYVNDLAADAGTASQPPEAIRANIVKKAAALGLPVQDADVHVMHTESTFRIQVLYLVHVDLLGYSVDLHFRPAAGGL